MALLPVKAQYTAWNDDPKHLSGYSPGVKKAVSDSAAQLPKWQVSRFMGVSANMGFFNGGNATVLSVPIGVQLSRRLSNNWYAFAGVVAAPTYTNFNHSFLHTNSSKTFQRNGMFPSGRFDLNTRAEAGLMYINNQKTFSISGSIGIERNSYPWLSPAIGTGTGFRPTPFRY
jgi:hypothetical protein